MQALVHFAVGVSMALGVLAVVERPVRQEFLAAFLGGFWALVPDGHWLLREFGLVELARAWRAFHGTPFANVFWFHHVIDALETGHTNLEAGASLALLFVVVLGYYRYNDWTVESASD